MAPCRFYAMCMIWRNIMSKIDRRFYNELFETKIVKLANQHYKECYNVIWPCEETFKKFLIATESTVKLKYAKEIFMYMQSFGKVFLPKTYIDNMIHYQQTNLVSNNSYIPQDHVVHSVNLYILGIYLFFNSTVFHYNIIDKCSLKSSKKDIILSFLDKWKTFAYYHDIGYYFEGNIKGDGNFPATEEQSFNEYIDIFKNLTSYHVVRSTARLITDASILQNSNIKFDHKEVLISNGEWVKRDCPIEDNQLIGVLKTFDNATILKNVYGDVGFNNLKPFIYGNKYVKLFFNEHNELVKFIIQENSREHDIYYNNSIVSQNESFDIYSIKYVIPDFKRSIKNDYGLADHFFDDLPEKLRVEFKFITNGEQLNTFFNNLNLWLLKSMNGIDYFESSHTYNNELSEYYIDSIRDCFTESIASYLRKQKKTITSAKLINIIKRTIAHLNNDNNIIKLSTSINNLVINRHTRDSGVSYDIVSYCSRMYNTVTKEIGINKTPDPKGAKSFLANLEFIKKNKEQIKLSLFAHNKSKESKYKFENALFEEIANLSKEMDIDFKKLISYKPTYSNCDHGLISAGLLYQAVVFTSYLAQMNDPSMRLSWYGIADINELMNDTFLNEYADVIFAVLLHNIYTKESGSEYGIEYKQKIDVNPFSYFCAFCDTLQKWGREKQVDVSKIDIPEINYLDDNFDIFVTGNHINITSTSANEQAIKRSLKDEATFLEGIEQLIHVGN